MPVFAMRTRARRKRVARRAAWACSWVVVAPRERPVAVRVEVMVEWIRGWECPYRPAVRSPARSRYLWGGLERWLVDWL